MSKRTVPSGSPEANRDALLHVLPGLSDKLITFRDDFFWPLEEIAPDPSRLYQLRQGPSEGLDGQPTVVPARLDCSKNGVEVDVTTPGHAAVVV
jgi:hypothetical protein